MVVEYNAIYKKIMTVDNGGQLRFVYVAKKKPRFTMENNQHRYRSIIPIIETKQS